MCLVPETRPGMQLEHGENRMTLEQIAEYLRLLIERVKAESEREPQ